MCLARSTHNILQRHQRKGKTIDKPREPPSNAAVKEELCTLQAHQAKLQLSCIHEGMESSLVSFIGSYRISGVDPGVYPSRGPRKHKFTNSLACSLCGSRPACGCCAPLQLVTRAGLARPERRKAVTWSSKRWLRLHTRRRAARALPSSAILVMALHTADMASAVWPPIAPAACLLLAQF